MERFESVQAVAIKLIIKMKQTIFLFPLQAVAIKLIIKEKQIIFYFLFFLYYVVIFSGSSGLTLFYVPVFERRTAVRERRRKETKGFPS